MKKFRQILPVILLTLFEMAVGILLLVNPEGFTNAVIIAFGVAMLVIGVIHFIKYFVDRKDGTESPLTIISAVILLLIGAVCAFASSAVMGLFSVIVIIYGVMLIVSGVYKISFFATLKKAGALTSPFMLISAVLGIILGVVVIIFSFQTAMIVWQIAGVSLIVEAAIDLISVIHTAVKKA